VDGALLHRYGRLIRMLKRYLRFAIYDTKFAFRHFLLNCLAGSAVVPRGLRLALYRAAGIHTGWANIYPGVRFLGMGRVTICNEVMINIGVTVDNRGSVFIGPRTHVAPEVYLGTSTHALGSRHQRAGRVQSNSIYIGAGVWIGARAVILPGVTIKDGAVIAAGSVVNKDCEANTLYAGVPARSVKFLEGGQ
jgi:maltose O-acetyltransferase